MLSSRSLFSAVLSVLLTVAGSEISRAEVCPNCFGTGRMINNFQNVKCSKCNGDGVVEEGGIPTPQIPEIPEIPEMGYQTNKFELKGKVEKGGWKVAWADDISETDAAQGLASIGVSVAAANPGPFLAWLEALVQRTITSLETNAASISADLKLQIRDVAAEVIRSAVEGKSAREIAKRLGQVDLKAGAIRYAGRNYVGNLTISTTWGLKPYIALRWRQPNDDSEPSTTPDLGTQPIPGDPGVNTDDIFDNAMKTYRVVLRTGDNLGAGTDADVFITVFGIRGIKEAIPLEKPGNDRERGDTDIYKFKCRNLGQITSANIWHDNSGAAPGWYLNEIRIENVEDSKIWFFTCDKWLALDEDDHRIGRMFEPSGQVD